MCTCKSIPLSLGPPQDDTYIFKLVNTSIVFKIIKNTWSILLVQIDYLIQL